MRRRTMPSTFIGVFFALALLSTLPGRSNGHFAFAAHVKDDTAFFCDDCEAPGVGFSLRPDYGTVAVKLREQTPVPLTRINGTESYKTLMRMGKEPESLQNLKSSARCNAYHSMVPQSIQDYLDYCPRDQHVNSVQYLLEQLKKAAEDYLGHKICLVNIDLQRSGHEHTEEDRRRQTIDAAISNLGLTQALDIKTNPYAMALQSEGFLRKYEMYGRPGYDESDLVLAIESDSSGVISLDLALLDYVGSYSIRENHNVTGTVKPPECLDEQVPAACVLPLLERQQATRDALVNIKAQPFDELPWDQEMPTRISKIMVYGDAANDEMLHGELLALFGLELVNNSMAKEPMYASAMGGATLAFHRINDVSYYDRSPAWCCWRSWGKACPNNPQRIDL